MAVGYDKASAIAHQADNEGTTLRQAALALGGSAADFDRIVDTKSMVGDPRHDRERSVHLLRLPGLLSRIGH